MTITNNHKDIYLNFISKTDIGRMTIDMLKYKPLKHLS